MKVCISSTVTSSGHGTSFEENNELQPSLLRLPPAWTQGGIRSRQGFCRSRADRENRPGGEDEARAQCPAQHRPGAAWPPRGRAGTSHTARHPSKGSAVTGATLPPLAHREPREGPASIARHQKNARRSLWEHTLGSSDYGGSTHTGLRPVSQEDGSPTSKTRPRPARVLGRTGHGLGAEWTES